MKITGIEWTDRARVHIEQDNRGRGISCELVEAIMQGKRRPVRVTSLERLESGEEKLYVQARVGARVIAVIVLRDQKGVAKPLTAWPETGRKLEKFLGWERSRRS
jgi:hypothetical protein